MNILGEKIKLLRDRLGLTQTALAQELNEQFNLKIDRVMISKWETGFQIPVMNTIVCLSKFFDVSIDYLNGIKEEDLLGETPTVPKKKGIKIPVLGRVQAGVPIEAIEDILDYEEITEEMAKTGEFFALSVKGDSMEPRICEGDVVVVRRQGHINSGDIAIVLVNGDDATIKKVKIHASGISLIPFNATYPPAFYTSLEVDDLPVVILGKVVELRGKFA